MNFTTVSKILTNGITKDLNYNDDKKEIIAYTIETVLLSICGIFLIVIWGYLLNALVPVAIAAVFGGILRRLSGGAHFNMPLKCLLFGSIIYSLIGLLAKMLINYKLSNQNFLVLILIIALLIVAILAPVDSQSKPIHSLALRRKLKISSMIFIIASILVLLNSTNMLINVSAALGVFYQSITLLPIFNRKGGVYV